MPLPANKRPLIDRPTISKIPIVSVSKQRIQSRISGASTNLKASQPSKVLPSSSATSESKLLCSPDAECNRKYNLRSSSKKNQLECRPLLPSEEAPLVKRDDINLKTDHTSKEFQNISAASKAKLFCCPDSKCNKKYTSRFNLKKHLRKRHPLLNTEELPVVKCEECNMTFKRVFHLVKHKRSIHSKHKSTKAFVRCCFCEQKFEVRSALYKHFEQIHEVFIKVEKISFDKYADFSCWKEKIEKETSAMFIKMTSTKKGPGVKYNYFRCHRSGYFKSVSKGLRHPKTLVSHKINNFCPAALKVTVHEDGKCTVSFTSTHLGHSNEVEHLSIASSEREIIAATIAEKVPFHVILEGIKDSISGKLERVHFTNKKDLYNIEAAYLNK